MISINICIYAISIGAMCIYRYALIRAFVLFAFVDMHFCMRLCAISIYACALI